MRISLALLVLMTLPALGQEEPAESEPAESEPVATTAANPEAEPADTVKTLSGMSILGNEEAPKSLVIVPWKSSRLGDELGISLALDETPRAVDREVFMRELRFYELRSGGEQ